MCEMEAKWRRSGGDEREDELKASYTSSLRPHTLAAIDRLEDGHHADEAIPVVKHSAR